MTITATVTNLDDERLIRDGEAAADTYNQSRDQARAQIMPMALGLLAARRKYPADQNFGAWLLESPYREIEYNERAALIKIGEHEAFATKFIRTTKLISPRTIWDAIEELLPAVSHDVKPSEPTLEIVKTDAPASTTPSEQVSKSGEVVESEDLPSKARYELVASADTILKNVEQTKLVKDLGITVDDYTTLFSAYPGQRQTVLKSLFGTELKKSKKKKKNIRALLMIGVAIVRAGKAPNLTKFAAFDARVFLPDLPESIYKYVEFSHLVAKVDRIEATNARAAALKAAGASAEALYEQVNHFWQHGSEPPPKAKREIAIDPADSKARIKHDVVFCGKVIWPCDGWKHVSYEDLNAGYHLIDYWANHLGGAQPQKPKEIAVQLRHLIQDIRAAKSIEGLTDAMLSMVSAYSKNEGKDKADTAPKMPPGLAR